MKTSDKLLLVFIVLLFSIFTAIHLTLYAKYKSGNIVTEKMLLAERFMSHRLPAPSYVSVKGFQNVRIIPSDSFYFEIEKEAGGKAGYQLINDTLSLKGDTTEIKNNHQTGSPLNGKQIISEGSKFEYRIRNESEFKLSSQQLILHCPTVKKISIEDGYIIFHGNTEPLKADFDLNISNCTFNLSNSSFYDTTYTNRYYHNIIVHSAKSFVTLNRNAVINSFTVLLDDGSEVTDNKAIIENFFINCTPGAKLHLSGENFAKVKLTTR